MKILAVSLLVLMLTGAALADPPTTQPIAAYSYDCRITAIGNGTLDVHVLRGYSGIIHPVNVDEKTEVVLLNSQPGKLSDLKVGQWVKVCTNPDANNAKEQRVVKIEPGMSPWAAQRLADLEKEDGTLGVGITVFVNGKGDEEELFLLGPDNKGSYKEPFFARLTKDEMTKLLRHLALDGFLADAFDRTAMDGKPRPSVPPYVRLSAGQLYREFALNPESLKRLEGIKVVLPEQAAAKMEGLLLPRVRKIVGVAATQPAASQPADPESAWQGVLKALQAADKNTLAAVTASDGYESIVRSGMNGPHKDMTPEQMKSLGQAWAKWELRFTKKTADAATAELGPIRPAVPGLSFVKMDEGWKLDKWTPGE